jgi:hypothetical protein
MKTRFAVLAVALAVMVGFAVPASAGPVAVDAGWYGFCFAGVGSPATAGCQNSGVGNTGNPFTWTSSAPTLLKVTDAFEYGDMFNVNIDSVLYTTSVVPTTFTGSVVNPDTAFADAGYSKGSWVLAAGSHSVNIFANASPYGGGGAYLEVETYRGTVPDAGSSLLLLGMGLAGLSAWRKRS